MFLLASSWHHCIYQQDRLSTPSPIHGRRWVLSPPVPTKSIDQAILFHEPVGNLCWHQPTDCTPKAIQHRIARLKGRCDEINDTPNGTPTKRKCGPSPGSSKKNKKARPLEKEDEPTPDAAVAVLTEKAEPSKADNSRTEPVKLEDYEYVRLIFRNGRSSRWLSFY